MQLFGDKTVSFLDVWSLEHFVSGISTIFIINFLCQRFLPEIYASESIPPKVRMISTLLCYLLGAYIWEVIEFYLEAGYTHNDRITTWFRGVEHWSNRLISDPAITTAGGYVGYRYSKLELYARVFSVSWLLVHVFIFPDCMYLQDKIEAGIAHMSMK